MIYHRRDEERNRKKRIVTWSVIGAVAVFILIANFFFPRFLFSTSHAIGTPIVESRATAYFGLADFFGVFHSKLSLIEDNRALREKLALMNATEAERAALSQENTTLRSLLNRIATSSPGTLAHVIAKPGYSAYDTLVIDAGSSVGVKVGDIVIANNSVIIGQVEAVAGHSSNVLLYSAPDQKNDVFVGAKSLETTATGKGGGVFEIRLPKNAGISEGDAVVIAGYPEKVFGSISSIENSPADSFDRMLFRSPVDIDSISYVTIEPPVPNEHPPVQTHESKSTHR